MRYPVVDIGECNMCGGCVELAPEVFVFNEAAGFVEVREMDAYVAETVDEAIKNCPQSCISWEG